MKNLIKIALGAGLAFTLTSCAAVNDPYGNNYPNQYPQYPNHYPQGGVYRAGDGTVYRQGEVYRDNSGTVYQNGRIVRRGDVYGRPGIISRGQNYPVYGNTSRNLPPGQAKKIYGGRATDYAKGQQKKHDKYYNKKNGKWENDDRRWRDDDRRWDDDKRYKKGETREDREFQKWKDKRYKGK